MRDLFFAQAKSLKSLTAENCRRQVNTHYELGESLNALRSAAIEQASPTDSPRIAAMLRSIPIQKDAPYTVDSQSASLLADQLIAVFSPRAEASGPPDDNHSPISRVIPTGRKVFLVHGHDSTNTLRLRTLLKERFALSPIILSEQPSRGRSVIEKFEAEAGDVSFAFVLMTPDDFVTRPQPEYSQARPNVLFELGWFYGRLGRERVCILFREGTSVPSDLDGIVRIQFRNSIDEKLGEIETELKAARLLPI